MEKPSVPLRILPILEAQKCSIFVLFIMLVLNYLYDSDSYIMRRK